MKKSGRLPALFLGHGSPMHAIEDGPARRGWRAAAAGFPEPRAVLCVSAHWETSPPALTAAARPETIHDFYGFPQALFDVRYPAPGEPALAQQAARLLGGALDAKRGLDHGAWSVLSAMYPKAEVPVVQLSLDTGKPGPWHAELAAKLAPLRDEGVLILGSGNIVHNLGLVEFRREDGFAWAARLDALLKDRVCAGDLAALADYETLDPEIRLAVPTPEHYLPLLYVLALRGRDEPVAFFNESVEMGSMSMTCVRVG